MKMAETGEAPDCRFSLANERTFLAWIRTALAFLAGGVGLAQLAPTLAPPLVREGVALVLCLSAGGLACLAYQRWRRNEIAMRLKQDLPYHRGLPVTCGLMVCVALCVTGMVMYAG